MRWLMSLVKRGIWLVPVVCFLGAGELDLTAPEELPDYKMTVAKWVRDFPKKPRFTGEFTVGVVFIDFPDTVPIDRQSWLDEHVEETVAYFKRYTQGVCYPKFIPYEMTYRAPHVRGYYTTRQTAKGEMPLGFETAEEGRARYQELEKQVDARVRRLGQRQPQITLYVYGSELLPIEELGELAELRAHYPESLETATYSYGDQLVRYRPEVNWGEPLWPKAFGRKIIVQAGSGAGTLIHELGHILGAPDAYHAPEKRGGVPGNPMTLPGGPTGPLFWRWKYCGLLPKEAFPLITADTEITLAPRGGEYQQGGLPLGVLIPTAHPYYMLHLEYEPGKVKALQELESSMPFSDDVARVTGGIHIYYINICQQSSYGGHPDLVYTYRKDDPWLQGDGYRFATFREGDLFTTESNPANLLPNQLPTGVELTFGEQTVDGATVSIKVPVQLITGRALKKSLLPIVELTAVRDPHPGSFTAELFVRFRGEPHVTERGFVYGSKPHPTLNRDKVWKLEGIGYEATRITGVPPGATVYVRAYVKSPLGVVYSETEEKLVIPKQVTETPALLCDEIDYTNKAWLVQLLNFYRQPLIAPAQLKPEAPLDYQRIHGSPMTRRYPPTLQHHTSAVIFQYAVEHTLGIATESSFPEDFEARLTRLFKLPPRTESKGKSVVMIEANDTVSSHLSQIQAALARGNPVVVFRELRRSSSSERVGVCLIDGYREGESGPELHISFPMRHDPGIQPYRTNGWFAPDILSESVARSCLLFINPFAKRR